MAYNVRTVDGDVKVVEAAGQLDHHNGTKLMQETLDPIKRIRGARVVVNFGKVEYICSAAIAILIEVNDKLTAHGGKFACCNISPEVMEVLDLLAIPEVIPCLETEADAIKAVSGEAEASA